MCIASIIRVIALMTEAIRTSETSVYSEITRRYIPHGSNLYIYSLFNDTFSVTQTIAYIASVTNNAPLIRRIVLEGLDRIS
jgi:hypothetical protein